jgi:hypothetical protein
VREADESERLLAGGGREPVAAGNAAGSAA